MGLEEREILRANREATERPPERPKESHAWRWVFGIAIIAVVAWIWYWIVT
jgi:hypothetical protein